MADSGHHSVSSDLAGNKGEPDGSLTLDPKEELNFKSMNPPIIHCGILLLLLLLPLLLILLLLFLLLPLLLILLYTNAD